MKLFQIQQKNSKNNCFKKTIKDCPSKKWVKKLFRQNLELKLSKDFPVKTRVSDNNQ